MIKYSTPKKPNEMNLFGSDRRMAVSERRTLTTTFFTRVFQDQISPLHHAFTSEHMTYLMQYYSGNKEEDGSFIFEKWKLLPGDISTWPTMDALPSQMNPINCGAKFSGKVPKQGQFPPNADGSLQSCHREDDSEKD